MGSEPRLLERDKFSLEKADKNDKRTFEGALQEVIGVGATTISIFVLICLMSYTPNDPSFNSLSGRGQVENYGGIIGSYLADLMLQGFGMCAFLLTLILLCYGIICFFHRPIRKRLAGRPILIRNQWARLGVSVVIITALSTLVSIISREHKLYDHSIYWGGAIGRFIELVLTEYFNTAGAVLLITAAILAGLLIITPLSIVSVSRLISGGAIILGRTAGGMMMAAWGALSKRMTLRLAAWRLKRDENAKQRRLTAIWNRVFKRNPQSVVANESMKKAELAPAQAEAHVVETSAPKEESKNQTWTSLFGKARIPGEEPKSASECSEKSTPLELPLTYPSRSHRIENFRLPALSLLNASTPSLFQLSQDELVDQAQRLEKKLLDYEIQGRVVDVHPGPVITLYEFEPAAGVKVKNILNLVDDLKMALRAVSVRIIAPIPGKAAVGIEIPNAQKQTVLIRDILAADQFQKQNSPLTLVFGKTTSGDPFAADLRKMPHLLIAGATGSGKSVGINTMICSVLQKATPDQVRFIMIDPKMLELSMYEGIPHLLLPVVTDPRKATKALRWAVREMERRYHVINLLGARNIQGYNLKVERLSDDELRREREKARELERFFQAEEHDEAEASELPEEDLVQFEKLPYLVIVIDELADLIMVSGHEVEESITRLAQMARAAGIHLIVATQRPSVDVITGLIKANFPARISFQVSSRVDSRTILDTTGAESLLGDGDMLYLPPGTSRLQRIHGALVTEEEIERIVSFLKSQGAPSYDGTIVQDMAEEENSDSLDDGERDSMYQDAVRAVMEMKNPSISLLQRRLRIGYNRAARMIEMMEKDQIITPPLLSGKGREVLVRSSD